MEVFWRVMMVIRSFTFMFVGLRIFGSSRLKDRVFIEIFPDSGTFPIFFTKYLVETPNKRCCFFGGWILRIFGDSAFWKR